MKKINLIIILSFYFMLVSSVSLYSNEIISISKQINEKRVTINLKDSSLGEILSEITKQTRIGFVFSNDKIDKNRKMSLVVTDITTNEALNQLFKETNLKFVITNNLIHIGIDNSIVTSLKKGTQYPIGGKVVDTDRKPLVGATVLLKNSSTGAITDANGKFVINAKVGDVFEFSFVGCKTKFVKITKVTSNLLIILEQDNMEVDDVVVVAFGTQKKESVVSAITSVRAKDLKSSSSDLTSQFAGKIAGIVGWQTGGLPGALTEDEMNTKFYIRGITSFQSTANIDPLVLIDGVESSKLDLARIRTEDIETFSVLKDASATAMYGARGANGVILVTTKKGSEGDVYASVFYEAIGSMATSKIDVVDPITYMKMYNQALIGRNPSLTPKYSSEQISRTNSGKYPSFVYPSNDWYDLMFKDVTLNHHMGVSFRGGSKVMQYYASLNHNRDRGNLRTDKLNDFNTNINNNSTNFNTNLNVNLSPNIKLLINAKASLDKYHGPYTDARSAYAMSFYASPVDFAATYPADETYNWNHLRFGSTLDDQLNPYEELHRGYSERTRYSATTRAEYIHNLNSLVKGLEIRASVSMYETGYYTTGYTTIPFTYSLENYDFETGGHTLRALNPVQARRTLEVDDSRTSSMAGTQVTYEGRIVHSAAWGNHSTGLTGVVSAQESTQTPVTSVLGGMPQRNFGISARGTYGYMDKYFLEATFGYNGSERFHKKNKMGLFPAAGFAWVLSKENFMRNSTVFSFLKLRGSYGWVGNDGIVENPRFVYLPTISGSEEVINPGPGGENMRRYSIIAYPNENITWEVAEQGNIGLEIKMFGELLELNIDAYNSIRHNIIAYRNTIPANMGMEVSPMDNIGKARSYGFDFSGKIQHAFSSDFWIILNGTFTYNKTTYLEIEEPSDKPIYQSKIGKEISQSYGYIAEGLFRDDNEIKHSPVQGGNVMPGDIRYRDINRDGVINVNDVTAIGFPEVPRVTYGFSGIINYKNVEFGFAFQGSGKRGFFMDPTKINPFTGDHAMLTDIYNDHWSEDNMNRNAFWPRLSTNPLIQHNPQEDWYNYNNNEIRKSTFFMRECSFLRCTSLDIAYNMSSSIVEKLKLQNIKFILRVNNPFIISNFKTWDVELGENGFNYPIQRTFSAGINISF